MLGSGYRATAVWRSVVAFGLLLVVAVVVAGCGGLSDSGTEASSSGGSFTELAPGKPESSADKKALGEVPSEYKDVYAGFWNSTRLGPDPYADWKPEAAPWKFCYSSAYQGNSWRVEGSTVAENMVEQLEKEGLAEGGLTVADANNSASLQATQINTMVQQGCDVIIAMQPPTVGECSAFENARNKGVLVVAVQTGTDCTDVMQSDFGEYQAGEESAKWLVEKTGGNGTVVMCNGIPGVAAAEARQSAARSVFQESGMKIAEITGQWTPSTVKSQMLSYLSTHQGEVAAVWDGGVCATAVSEAFKQAGKKLPYVSGFEGACSWLATWKEDEKESIGFAQSGGQAVAEAMKVALRMLSGQTPKFNTILYPLQQIDAGNFNQYYKPQMTTTSECNAQPTGEGSVEESYYDGLFEGGKPAPAIKPELASLPIQ